MNKIGTLLFLLGVSLMMVAFSCHSTPAPEPGSYPAAVCRYVPERSEDFSFENDLTAYRCYGPALLEGAESGGIDVWLKAVDYPVMKRLYAANLKGKSYHVFNGEAYDPYHVGASLGCGGAALSDGEKLHLSNVYREYKIIEESGDRAQFELIYLYDDAAGSQFEEKRLFTIEKGKYLFRVDLSVRRLSGDAELSTAAGLTLHDGAAAVERAEEGKALLISETIDGHFIGAALYPLSGSWAPKEMRGDAKDDDHLLAIWDLKVGDEPVSVSYLAGYGWSGRGVITDAEVWKKTVDSEIAVLSNK